MRKYFSFAIAFCVLIAPAIGIAQRKPGFIIFLKESPPPTEPGDWFVIFPTTMSAQAILAAGFHPFEFVDSEATAFYKAADLISNRFPQVCKKDTLRFVNPQMNPPVVFVNEFAAPKPFGMTYQGPPICGCEARLRSGSSCGAQVGPTFVSPNFHISGPVRTPPPLPSPRTSTGGNPLKPQAPPRAQAPPGVIEGGDLPVPRPIPPDDPALSNTGRQVPIPASQTKSTMVVRTDAGPPRGATPSVSSTTTQTRPTTAPIDPSVANISGTWRRDGWTSYAIQTITQSGTNFQWSHTYQWGAPMRTESAIGRVQGTCQGTRVGQVEVDIVYTYSDSTPTGKASYAGRLSCDANGKVVSIRWSNGSSYSREQSVGR